MQQGTALEDQSREPLDPWRLVDELGATAVRQHMSIAEAKSYQFELVDAIQRHLGSDEIFSEDYGQARELGALGGGRPLATSRVEEVLADVFGVASAALVHGAGTGSIREMVQATVGHGARLLLHASAPYKTTAAIFEVLGVIPEVVDMNAPDAVASRLRERRVDAVYVQHTPHQLGDCYDVGEIIKVVRSECGPGMPILVDDNYVAMRSPRLGVMLGADASAFSLFKLLARTNVGCVVGSSEIVATLRRRLSSAGSQVQGPEAMDAMRSLVYAPVALAIQNEAVMEATAEINALVDAGRLPGLCRAVAAQPGMRSIVLVFEEPIGEHFLRYVWKHGSPSRSVGEEARYDVVPLFTYLAGTFIKGRPGIERYAVRVNPLRGGPGTIVRVLTAAMGDRSSWEAAS